MKGNVKPRLVRANDVFTKTAPDDMFIGQVFQGQIFVPEDPSRLRITRVTFSPGGRTNWHTHAVGQILCVLSGVDRYQLEGQPVQEIQAGDSVVIPPKSRHWQGAAPNQMMRHLAISETDDTGAGTDWLEPLSEKDFDTPPQ